MGQFCPIGICAVYGLIGPHVLGEPSGEPRGFAKARQHLFGERDDKAGIETARPKPGATRQGWLTYREVPMVLVAEDKDRAALSDALGVLLHEGRVRGPMP